MAQVIVRKLDETVVAALKTRAAANGRSLEQELRLVLALAAKPTRAQVAAAATAIRSLSAGVVEVDIDELIRKERASR